MKKLVLSAMSALMAFAASAQCGPFFAPDICGAGATVTIPASVNICAGTGYTFTPSIVLPTGFSVVSYNWTPPTGVSPAASGTGLPPSTTITPPAPGTAPAPCSELTYTYKFDATIAAPNVVYNPDFSMGATNFCSDFTYVAPGSLMPSKYTITTDAITTPGFGTHFYDHTTPGSGKMLIVHSDANTNNAWNQKVALCPGEKYTFSFWHATLHTSPALNKIYVIIKDGAGVSTSYGPFTSTAYDTWEQFSVNWTNPSGGVYTTATAYLSAKPAGGGGSTNLNKYAIDDISFRRTFFFTRQMAMRVFYPPSFSPLSICKGNSVSLAGCAGGSYSSSNTSVASVGGTGVVTGMGAGTATITYTNSIGCITTVPVSVLPIPVISSSPNICIGGITTLTSSPAGTWTCTSGVLNMSGVGTMSSCGFMGAIAGSATVTVTSANGCSASTTFTVNPLPVITGPSTTLCSGVPNSFTTTTGASGTWSAGGVFSTSSGPGATGIATASTGGSGTITFTDALTGCSSTISLTAVTSPTITGPTSVCNNTLLTWTSVSGSAGFWTSTGPMYNYAGTPATVSNTWAAYGVGNPTITFTEAATGCVATASVTINEAPSYIPVQYTCMTANPVVTNAVSGGTWTSVTPTVATIDPVTGMVYPVNPGTATMTYTLPDGCSVNFYVVVFNCGGGAGVVGGGTYCQGAAGTMILATGIPTGGTWSSSDGTIVSINPTTGAFSCLAGGTVTITYTVGSSTWTTTITVIASATASVYTTWSLATDYVYNFNSDCSTTPTYYYSVYNAGGGFLGSSTTTASSIPLSSLVSIYGVTAYRVCVYGVLCNGCYNSVSSCAIVNYKPAGPSDNTTPVSEVSIVPNPNNGEFTLTGSFDPAEDLTNVQVEITDILGKTVLAENCPINNNHLSKPIVLSNNLPAGMYIARVTTGGHSKVIKFVLSK